MRNLSVKVDADIGGYTTNMTLASRIAREKMGESAGAVINFQKSVDSSAATVQEASRSMASNMTAANDAIMRGANDSAAAIDGISKSAENVKVSTLGEKVREAMSNGATAAKAGWDDFSAWAEAKSKATGIAIGIILAGTIAGAVYTAYKVITGTIDLIKGAISGSLYKSENIDALIASNAHVKELQASLALSAQDATALGAALASLGTSKDDYVSVFQSAEKAIHSNAEELDRLGVKYKDADGKFLATRQIIENISGVLDQYTEGWDRNQAAASIGIGTAAQIAAALKVTNDVLVQARERINDYNLGIGPEAQAAIDRYQTAIRQFNRENELTSQAFKRVMSDNIMPLLTDLAEWFTGGWPTAVKVFRIGLGTVTSAFWILKTTVFDVAEIVVGAAGAATTALIGIGSAAASLIKGDMDGAKKALLSGWTDAKGFLDSIGTNIEARSKSAGAAIRSAYALDDRGNAVSKMPPQKRNPWVPPTAGAAAAAGLAPRDDVDKAIMEGAIKEQEAFIAAEKAQLQTREQFLQTYYQQEYFTTRQFFDTKQQLIQDALAAELSAYDKEIKALEVYRATRTKETASREQQRGIQDADNRIAEVRAKMAAATLKANNEMTKSYVDLAAVQRGLDLQTREWTHQEELRNDSTAFAISMMGRNTVEVEKLTAAERIRVDVMERVRQAQLNNPQADVSKLLAAAAADTDRAVALIQERANKERDAWFGAGEAVRKYGEAAANVGSQVENALTNAFKSAEDVFVTFMQTGKVNFKNFANSIIADLARIQFKKSIVGPISAAIDEAGGIAGLASKLFGITPVSIGYGTIDPTTSGIVGSFDVGTNYVPRTGLALVHQGEKITPAGQNNGGGTVVINQNVYNDSRSDITSINQSMAVARQQSVAAIRDLDRRTVR